MKRCGFTLIELLAVIVVLAIIALIATPIVMNTIEKSKKGAAERSTEEYVHAVDTAIMEAKTSGDTVADGEYTVDSEGNLCATLTGDTCGDDKLLVSVTGTKPDKGSKIVIQNNEVVSSATISSSTKTTKLTYDDKYETTINDSGKATATEKAIVTNQTIYLWYNGSNVTGPTINDTLTESQLESYSKTAPTDKNFYLKLVVNADNVVSEGYACAKYDVSGVVKEACIKGGNLSFYEENNLILQGLRDNAGFSYESNGATTTCSKDSIQFINFGTGDAQSYENIYYYCSVGMFGSTGCYSLQ